MRKAPVLLLVALLTPVAACNKGVMPVWSQANPCLDIRMNPVTKTMSIFTNEGRSLDADELTYGLDAEGKRVFSAKNLRIGERTVENRIANVEQMKIGVEMTRVAMQEFTAAVRELYAPFRGATVDVDTPIGKGSIKTGGGEAAQPAARQEPTTVPGQLENLNP